MRSQLIADSTGSADPVKMFVDKTARIVRIFIKELGRQQCIADDVPGNGVANIIETDVVGIHTQLALVACAQSLRDLRVQSMGDENVGVIIREITLVAD